MARGSPRGSPPCPGECRQERLHRHRAGCRQPAPDPLADLGLGFRGGRPRPGSWRPRRSCRRGTGTAATPRRGRWGPASSAAARRCARRGGPGTSAWRPSGRASGSSQRCTASLPGRVASAARDSGGPAARFVAGRPWGPGRCRAGTASGSATVSSACAGSSSRSPRSEALRYPEGPRQAHWAPPWRRARPRRRRGCRRPP
jgi:hypothetical protein